MTNTSILGSNKIHLLWKARLVVGAWWKQQKEAHTLESHLFCRWGLACSTEAHILALRDPSVYVQMVSSTVWEAVLRLAGDGLVEQKRRWTVVQFSSLVLVQWKSQMLCCFCASFFFPPLFPYACFASSVNKKLHAFSASIKDGAWRLISIFVFLSFCSILEFFCLFFSFFEEMLEFQ